MRKLVFSFLVVFSSIVFGQSGFNPPKTKINEPLKVENIGIDTNIVLNDTAIFPYQICYIATVNGAGYSVGDVIEFNVMYDLKNPTTAWYFDYFNQNTQSFVYKDNSKNGQPILGAIPPITDLKPCIDNAQLSEQAYPFGYDAGGRTRVSQITTLLDGKILGIDDSDLFENVGTGTATFANNTVSLQVDGSQYMIRQSKRFYPYFSGKSQLIETTSMDFQIVEGYIKRIGYFSSNAVAPYDQDYDGFYLEANGINTGYLLIIVNNGVEKLKLDLTTELQGYDFENFSVMAFDFLWLGGAIHRAFLKRGLDFDLLNNFGYAGTAKDPFMKSPNQPIRYEIRGDGGAGTAKLTYVCSQVSSEGSFSEAGKTLALVNTTGINCNAIGTIYALKSIKKQVSYRDVAIQILDIEAVVSTNSDKGILMLFVNPTLSAPITYANVSKVQVGTPTNQTITPNTGRMVCATSVNINGASYVIKENFLSFLSGSITNTMGEYVLGYMPITTTQTVYPVMNIKEY